MYDTFFNLKHTCALDLMTLLFWHGLLDYYFEINVLPPFSFFYCPDYLPYSGRDSEINSDNRSSAIEIFYNIIYHKMNKEKFIHCLYSIFQRKSIHYLQDKTMRPKEQIQYYIP